nr:MAG TPA: hypothetical protein [Bacteriophage sp.]
MVCGENLLFHLSGPFRPRGLGRFPCQHPQVYLAKLLAGKWLEVRHAARLHQNAAVRLHHPPRHLQSMRDPTRRPPKPLFRLRISARINQKLRDLLINPRLHPRGLRTIIPTTMMKILMQQGGHTLALQQARADSHSPSTPRIPSHLTVPHARVRFEHSNALILEPLDEDSFCHPTFHDSDRKGRHRHLLVRLFLPARISLSRTRESDHVSAHTLFRLTKHAPPNETHSVGNSVELVNSHGAQMIEDAGDRRFRKIHLQRDLGVRHAVGGRVILKNLRASFPHGI